jgi:molecular chaperone GrpE
MKDRKRHMTNEDAQAAPDTEAPDTPMPEAQGDGEPAPDDESTVASATADGASQDDVARQLGEMKDKFLRLAAEYDNYRRRTAKERLEAGARGQAELVQKLLEPIDDLARFADIDPATTDTQTLHKGIELVEKKLLKSLDAVGLEVINPVDQTFDPNLHEAITTEAALSAEDDNTVSKVYQLGYRFNGQLLRPARVVVKQWHG